MNPLIPSTTSQKAKKTEIGTKSGRRTLIPGALITLLAAAGSGFMIPWAPDRLVVLHVAAGIGGLVPLSLFLASHWWGRRHQIRRHPNSRYGYLACACLVLIFLSGFALLRWTNFPPFQIAHTGAVYVLLFDLFLHAAWRVRLRIKRHPMVVLRSWPGFMLLAGLAALTTLVGPPQPELTAAASQPVANTHNTLKSGSLPKAADCQVCHSDPTNQWKISAHGHAATDPYYQALVALFIQEQGVEAARYCAACHNPVGLMGGEIDPQTPILTGEGTQAYTARQLGVSLTMSEPAAEGVTCAVCHLANQAALVPKNGQLTFANINDLPRKPMTRLALKSTPNDHQAAVQPPILTDAALCGSCHNLSLPSGLSLEPTYDEWLASPYPAQGVSCQTCHMPDVPGRSVDSTLGGTLAAHGALPGAPSSLPDLANDTTLLRQAATLDLDWAWAKNGELEISVAVTNSGAGHYFPTGADDLRQLWLAVDIRNAAGKTVWETGQLDTNGRLPPETTRFEKVLGDSHGRPIALHRFWTATQILVDTRLAPLEARRVIYTTADIDPTEGPFTVDIQLLYRDVSPDFAEFALARPITDLPHYEVASISSVISIP